MGLFEVASGCSSTNKVKVGNDGRGVKFKVLPQMFRVFQCKAILPLIMWIKSSGTVLLQVVISGPESIVFRSDGASFFFLNVTLRISIPPARIHLRASAEKHLHHFLSR